MNLLRNALIGGIVIVSFLLVIRWNEYQERKFEETQEQTSSALTSTATPDVDLAKPEEMSTPDVSGDVPTLETINTNSEPEQSLEQAVTAKHIHITTDALDVVIDTNGGDIIRVALPKHYAKLNEPNNPFVLLNKTEAHTYIAKSGLALPKGQDKFTPLYNADKTSYTLPDSEDSLQVDLKTTHNDLSITKRFRFTRGSNLIDVDFIITNNGNSNWVGAPYGQILRDDANPNNSTAMGMQPFLGAATTTPDTNYKKFSFKDLDEEAFNTEIKGGWVALVQHYFMSAWIPEPESTNKFHIGKLNSGLYILRFIGQAVTVAPGQTHTIKSQFYSGPKHVEVLEEIAPHLDLTIDFSWLWMIAKPLHVALIYIHDFVGNWGLAIIVLTFFIKLVFFYPSAMSYRSMAKMRKVQPLMQELKDRYGDDRQKMSAELMRLYKKEKVNPLGGCLPILLQMPVFIALYWMIMESVELRHAPFFLWIQDLSVRDPYFVLPLIMGATMWIQQKLNPTPPDPMQAKIMQMMPIFFTALFMMFPAGLVLYWVVNNTLSITQQYIITRQIEKAD